jgi:hypothetical protein
MKKLTPDRVVPLVLGCLGELKNCRPTYEIVSAYHHGFPLYYCHRIHRAETTCRHIVAFIIKLKNDGKFDSQCDLSGVPEQPDVGGDARQLSIAHV